MIPISVDSVVSILNKSDKGDSEMAIMWTVIGCVISIVLYIFMMFFKKGVAASNTPAPIPYIHSNDSNTSIELIANSVKELKNEMNKGFTVLKKEIADVYGVANSHKDSKEVNDNHLSLMRCKIAETIPYFKDDNLRRWIVRSSTEFIEWVMQYKDVMFRDQGTYDVAMLELDIHFDKVKEGCIKFFGKEFSILFFTNHNDEYQMYSLKIRKINDDMINNKPDKLVNASIWYMQQRISDFVKLWVDEVPDRDLSFDKEIDGLSEFKRIEVEMDDDKSFFDDL